MDAYHWHQQCARGLSEDIWGSHYVYVGSELTPQQSEIKQEPEKKLFSWAFLQLVGSESHGGPFAKAKQLATDLLLCCRANLAREDPPASTMSLFWGTVV